MKFKAIIFSLSLSLPVFAQTESPTYMLLKDRRDLVTLPKLSLGEKLEILNAARFVYRDLFVHEDWKKNRYGNKTELLPYFDELEAGLSSIDEETFHSRLTQTINQLQDMHTRYELPKPYSCYRNLLPISIQEIKDSLGKNKFVVSDKILDKEALSALTEPLQVKVGEEILEYNGMKIEDMIQKKMKNPGANPDALRRNAAFDLVFVSQKIRLAPKEDTVELVLKRPSGETYRTSLPWISKARSSCLKPQENAGERGQSLDVMDHKKIFRNAVKSKTVFRNMRSSNQEEVVPFQATEEPIVTWKTIKNAHGNFGVLKLESFEPEKLNVNETVALIKDLLLTKFPQTDGLIIDVRDNPGGLIRIGEYLVQLVTPKKISPLNFKVKANASTLHFFKNYYSAAFVKGIEEALAARETYSAPIPLNPESSMNFHGQVYYKPVALFTNAICYSTCDMIAAQMQDHVAAIIVGEDSTTGAGGANSQDLTSIYDLLTEKGPFTKLPRGSNIGFSWRQSVRIGKNAGKILEDIGVLSDHIIPPTVTDIIKDSQDQYAKIGKLLKDEYLKGSRAKVTLPRDTVNFILHARPEVFLKWENTNQIAAYSNDSLIDVMDVETSNIEGRLVDFSSFISSSDLTSKKVELRGLLNGTTVWKRILTLRTVPEKINIDASRPLSFQTDFALYGKDGWNVQDNELKIGSGSEYSLNLKTEASVFLSLNVPSKLSFKAKIKTEKTYDIFKVMIVSQGKETFLEKDLTGDLGTKEYSYDLSSYVGKEIEIRFIFESDNYGGDEGVTLKTMNLTEV